MNQQTTTVISLLCAFRTPIKMAELAIKANVSQRFLRLIIADIRENNLIEGYVLCSSDDGYFLSNDADTINQFLNRYLSYAFSMIKTSKAAKAFISEQHTKDIQLNLQF
jgi:hypothetical protein